MCDEYEVVNVNPDNYKQYIDPTEVPLGFWRTPEGDIITLWDVVSIAVMIKFGFGMGCEELDKLMPPYNPPGAILDVASDIHPWLDIQFCEEYGDGGVL